MADIAHHAHDLKLFVFRPVVLDEPADRILAGEHILGGLLVDDRDGSRAFGVVFVEVAAAHQRDPHRSEIIRRRDPDIGLVLFCTAGPIESAGTVSAGKWKAADRGYAFNARHAGHALQDLLVKLELSVLIRPRRHAYIKYQKPIRIKSGCDFSHVREALD